MIPAFRVSLGFAGTRYKDGGYQLTSLMLVVLEPAARYPRVILLYRPVVVPVYCAT